LELDLLAGFASTTFPSTIFPSELWVLELATTVDVSQVEQAVDSPHPHLGLQAVQELPEPMLLIPDEQPQSVDILLQPITPIKGRAKSIQIFPFSFIRNLHVAIDANVGT
jgi:hypothetical protein